MVVNSTGKKSVKSFKPGVRSNQENAELSEHRQICPNTEKIVKRKALGAVARNNYVDSKQLYNSNKKDSEKSSIMQRHGFR